MKAQRIALTCYCVIFGLLVATHADTFGSRLHQFWTWVDWQTFNDALPDIQIGGPDPESEMGYLMRGEREITNASAADPDEGCGLYRAALSKHPDSWALHMRYGIFLAENEQIPLSVGLSHLKEATELAPKNSMPRMLYMYHQWELLSRQQKLNVVDEMAEMLDTTVYEDLWEQRLRHVAENAISYGAYPLDAWSQAEGALSLSEIVNLRELGRRFRRLSLVRLGAGDKRKAFTTLNNIDLMGKHMEDGAGCDMVYLVGLAIQAISQDELMRLALAGHEVADLSSLRRERMGVFIKRDEIRQILYEFPALELAFGGTGLLMAEGVAVLGGLILIGIATAFAIIKVCPVAPPGIILKMPFHTYVCTIAGMSPMLPFLTLCLLVPSFLTALRNTLTPSVTEACLEARRMFIATSAVFGLLVLALPLSVAIALRWQIGGVMSWRDFFFKRADVKTEREDPLSLMKFLFMTGLWFLLWGVAVVAVDSRFERRALPLMEQLVEKEADTFPERKMPTQDVYDSTLRKWVAKPYERERQIMELAEWEALEEIAEHMASKRRSRIFSGITKSKLLLSSQPEQALQEGADEHEVGEAFLRLGDTAKAVKYLRTHIIDYREGDMYSSLTGGYREAIDLLATIQTEDATGALLDIANSPEELLDVRIDILKRLMPEHSDVEPILRQMWPELGDQEKEDLSESLMRAEKPEWRRFILWALDNESAPLLRARFITALARIGNPKDKELVNAALADKDPIVRGHAAFGIGLKSDSDSQALLRDLLKREESASVREIIEQALARI